MGSSLDSSAGSPTGSLAAVTAAAADLVKECAAGLTESLLYHQDGAIATALLEAVLACSSVVVPYALQEPEAGGACGESRGASSSSEETSGSSQQAAPQRQPQAAPLQQQPLFDQALLSCLAAAQLLLKALPSAQAPAAAELLLRLGVRLLATAPLGVQLTAAQRFLDSCISQCLPKAAGAGNGTAGQAAATAVAGVLVDAALQTTDALAACLHPAAQPPASGGADFARLPALLVAQVAVLAALCDPLVTGSPQQEDAEQVTRHATNVLLLGGLLEGCVGRRFVV